ncbi:uncharacterized protein KD926_004096 [Aspergillus affinis]|uniref:uncharacterized protein n=1 Tax=Aspergillus affinis TaxID=1070780 RepID=UPI0022FF1150|nr:uncharacterized protein KD926_004096 [Aspergillus affinis]KAI9046258.1 hypothetical protein KD926_004096 [Aspergillus affinis]
MKTIEKPQSRQLKSISWLLLVSSLLAALFLFALDNTIVANVQPSIIDTLGHIEKLPWISVSFSLGAVATNLPWGQLYSHFNNKLLFIGGVVIFEVGSAVCGAAPTLDALIIGRAICGIGGMSIYLGTINMVSTLTTETERPIYLGLVGLTWGIGTILGPIIGGAFTDSSATWRWSFYINLCIGGVAAPVYIFLLPESNPRPGLSFLSRARDLDFAGAILSAGAIASLIMAVSFGGAVFAWNSGQIIGLFVCTGVLWISFTIQQMFALLTTPEHRLFPVDLLRSWEMVVLFAQMASAQAIVTIPIYFIPLFFQFAENEGVLGSGVRLLPFVLVLVFAVMLNGALMAKVGYYMPWYVLGSILALIGSCLLYTIHVGMPSRNIYGFSALTALGVGLYSQAGFAVAQVKAAPQRLSQAVAFIGVGQVGSIALTLMISNSIFINRATHGIALVLPQASRDAIQQAISGARGSFFTTLSATARARVLEAIADTISEVFIMMIAAAGLSLILATFMKREKLFVAEEASKNSAGVVG